MMHSTMILKRFHNHLDNQKQKPRWDPWQNNTGSGEHTLDSVCSKTKHLLTISCLLAFIVNCVYIYNIFFLSESFVSVYQRKGYACTSVDTEASYLWTRRLKCRMSLPSLQISSLLSVQEWDCRVCVFEMGFSSGSYSTYRLDMYFWDVKKWFYLDKIPLRNTYYSCSEGCSEFLCFVFPSNNFYSVHLLCTPG